MPPARFYLVSRYHEGQDYEPQELVLFLFFFLLQSDLVIFHLIFSVLLHSCEAPALYTALYNQQP
jgi:hypothetical protein